MIDLNRFFNPWSSTGSRILPSNASAKRLRGEAPGAPRGCGQDPDAQRCPSRDLSQRRAGQQPGHRPGFENTPAGIKTFTGAFHEGPEFDETPYAREVAAACGAQNFEVYPTEEDFVELLPKLVYHMDEPAAGPGLFPQYMVSRLAARQVKVVLGGQGGDEIFGGYARYVIAYLEQALKGAILETTMKENTSSP